jgi:Tol biopolymer transport system component
MKSWYYVIAFTTAPWLLAAACGGKSDPGETAAVPGEERAAEKTENERGPEAWFTPEDGDDSQYPRNPNTELVSADELLVPRNGGKRAENVVAFTADARRRENSYHLALASVDGKYWADLGVEGRWPEFSPDGTKIAYAGPEGLCVINADGSGKTVIWGRDSVTGRPRIFAFMPDGRAVVYTASKGESTHGIFLADVAGRGRRLIYSSDEYLTSPSLPASGEEIAFQKGREIYVINVDGSGLRRVTDPSEENENLEDIDPTFSPDGSKIAFRSGDHDFDHDMAFDVYVVNADGTGRCNLTANDKREERPDFSRDGERTVFQSWEGGITVADVNTLELRRVPTTGGAGSVSNYLTPRFSPDGKKIAYDPEVSTGMRQIYVINADGTGDTWVSPGGRVSYLHPCFSPMRVDGVLLDTYGRVIEE